MSPSFSGIAMQRCLGFSRDFFLQLVFPLNFFNTLKIISSFVFSFVEQGCLFFFFFIACIRLVSCWGNKIVAGQLRK